MTKTWCKMTHTSRKFDYHSVQITICRHAWSAYIFCLQSLFYTQVQPEVMSELHSKQANND